MNTETASYRLYNSAEQLIYVGVGRNPEERFKYHAKYKPWWPEVARRDIRWHPDRPTALRDEAEAINFEHPLYNVARPLPDGSLRGGTTRKDVPEIARGASPPTPPDMRSFRMSDEVWLPARARAEVEGKSMSEIATEILLKYATEPHPVDREYTFANWPKAARWANGGKVAALYDELLAATAAYSLEYIAVAAWLAVTHHPKDVKQQKRVLTGHILRRALAADAVGPRERYRDSRHLSETVQAILERHLPLGEG